MNKENRSSYVAFLGIFTAVALILAFIESQIPTFIPIPGVKLGLPNIAIVIILYKLGFKESLIINVVRVLIISLLFGSALSLIYSLSGAILSTLLMGLLKHFNYVNMITVSVIGAVCHNITQVIVAMFILELNQLIYYLPILLISGTISGIFIGLIAAIICKRIDLKKEKDV